LSDNKQTESKRGRPKGSKNKRTLWLEQEAQKYGQDALAALAHIAKHGESESARVSAAEALLSRGWGRPRQSVEHTGESGGPVAIKVTHEYIDPSGDDG
jgi:hypothetical protein